MSFFRLYNADWSHLPQAISFKQGGRGFADDIPLAVLLNLTAAEIDRICGLPIACLHLSIICNQFFADRGTTIISQLLGHTLATFLGPFSIGYGSVMVVLWQILQIARTEDLSARESIEFAMDQNSDEPIIPPAEEIYSSPVVRTVHYASSFVSDIDNLELLTIRREWELFSGLPYCNASLPLESIGLSEETQGYVRDLGIDSLRGLLDWKVTDLTERLGDDIAEEVLEALTTYAAGIRLLPDPSVLLRSERTQDQSQVLEERWGNFPISALNLSEVAGRALRRASVLTISDLLFALDPLHVELALDPFAFMIIWAALEKTGLRKETCEAARERLSAEAYTSATLDHITASWHNSKQAHQWRIVSTRLGLIAQSTEAGSDWRMPTLHGVAAEFGLARERVRQIEVKFIKRLLDRQDEYFTALGNAMCMVIRHAGGIISLEQAVNEFTKWFNPGQADPEGFCRLILNNSSNIVPVKKNRIYALTSFQASLYPIVVDTTERIAKSSVEEYALDDLAAAVVKEMFSGSAVQEADADRLSLDFISACLTAANCFLGGIEQPTPIVLVRILRELGGPCHFNEITDRLNKSGLRRMSITVKHVHNYLLSRRDLFVHVSAGTYGLVEWGLEDQRIERGGEPIGDIVTSFLEARGTPADRDEIVAFVQAQKNCRGTSVMQILLYDLRFHRLDKDKYGLSKWTF